MENYDLLIVGGGFAGLTAAVRARELGLSVIVLEKGHDERYACNSRLSGGIIHFAMHDPYRSPEELESLARDLTADDVDERLLSVAAQDGRKLIGWLRGQGIRFMRFSAQEAYRWCMAPPRSLRAGIDWKDRGPDLALRELERRLTAGGGQLRRGTRVDALRMLGGRCNGVIATDDTGMREWSSRCVLLADGGFQANRDLYEKYIGPDFDLVFQRGAATGEGSGLLMAMNAGAAFSGAGRFYGHLLCRDAFFNDNVWPYPEIDAIATAGIVVDGNGQRLADEGISGVNLTNALAGKAARTLFAIFDSAIWEGPGRSARIPANPLLQEAGGTVHQADTIDELAHRIGVPVDQLSQTIAAYNAAIKTKSLDSLSVKRSSKIKPWPIVQAPVMAIPVCPGITYTMAGIAIDEHAQVLNEKGEPIPGLLASGATTGGIEGGRNAAYLGGLYKAGVFGLIAAEQAAKLTGKTVTPVPLVNSQDATAGSPAASFPQPLYQFPMLRWVSQHGKVASVAGSVIAALLVALTSTWWLGVYMIPVALFVAAVILIIGLCFTELIRLIIDMLLPDQGG